MSTYHSSGRTSARGLKIALFVTIALLVSVSLVIGLCLNRKTEVSVLPENNVKTEKLDSSALLGANGWNNAIATSLYQSLYDEGDNVALGNSGGVISARTISLGGYTWSIVYKQKGIVTLYAEEPVAYFDFDKASASYRDSVIREYLNGEFYENFVKKVGYSGFENMIVPFGSRELYYQNEGAQAIPLQTVAKENIANCDGVTNDKIWLPSAYEVGGFAVTETSPKARVNSFKTINSNGLSINSGLWNLSNDSRLKVDNALLRSTVGNGACVVANGVVKSGESGEKYAIRPCLNLVMPTVTNGALLTADESTYKSSPLLASATVSYISELSEYANVSGTTLTAKTGNVTVDGVTYTNSQKLLETLSDGVNLGADMSGYTINLVEDVDMSVFTVWNPIGKENSFAFAGVFNGNGYKISGLCSANSGFVGLFGYVAGSGASVKNVAVVDSSWYTTNSGVGGIVDVLGANATIESCYSESGISGANYIGGIVGKSIATSTIKNCYNKTGVTGLNFIGGIIGSNGGSTISYCYSVGALTGNGTNIGGIAGLNSSGTITETVYNSANVASSVTISGVTGADYSAMQGMKTSTITKPTSMTNWTFDGSPWIISAVENDRLPVLKTFIKNVTINVRSGDSTNLVSVNGGAYASSVTYSGASSSSTITIKARANFSGTSHYKLKSWDLYQESLGGNTTSVGTYATAGSATADGNYKVFTLTVTADDSYNFEAVFEKLYAFSISPVFNGFSDTSSYSSTELTYSIADDVSAFDEKWYPADTVANITIGTEDGRTWEFAGLTGSSDGGSTWSTVTAGGSDTFISQSGSTYEVRIGHSGAYVSNDSYILRPNFNRYYTITLTNSVPTATGATTPVTQMVISSPSATVKSSDSSTSAKMIYSGTVTPSVYTAESEYTKYFKFSKWELLNGSTVLASSTTASPSAMKLSSTPANSVTSLTLKATFDLQQITIGIKELVGSNETSSAGFVKLSADSNISSVTADAYPISVAYGSAVYVYILPSFASGYEFYSFNGSTSALTSVGSAGLLRTSVTATANTTYNVVYALAEKFNITFNATLDGTANSSTFTFSTTYSNKTINADISGATVTNEAGKYFLSNVTASYVSTSGEVKKTTVASTGYVAQSSNYLFDTLSTKTIAGLLNKIGATATYNQYNITVTANFISIVRTISVTEIWKGVDASNNEITLTHASAYTIYDNTASKSVTNQGTLNNRHTLTATPGTGYKVKSITTSSGIDLSNSIVDTWGENSTSTFTLSDNIAITITYVARTYTITATDYIVNTEQAVNSSYTFKIGNSTVTPATATPKKIYVNYGNTASISGYVASAQNSSNTDQMYELNSIIVKSGSTTLSTTTSIGTEWAKECTDENDNITVIFKYIILQKVQITLTDKSGSTTNANSALIVLTSTTGNPNIVILATKNQTGMYANCVLDGGYKVSAILPVYVSGTISGVDSGAITVTASSGTISVELEQDLQKGSVFAGEIFG